MKGLPSFWANKMKHNRVEIQNACEYGSLYTIKKLVNEKNINKWIGNSPLYTVFICTTYI